MNFSLGNNRVLVVVIKFDRILNRNDMGVVTLDVDDIDHRGQRGTFAGTGRPSHQHHSTRLIEEFLDGRRQPDLFKSQQRSRDLPQHHSKATLLLENTYTKTSQFAKRKREVSSTLLAHLLNAVVGSDGAHQLLGGLVGQRRPVHLLKNAVQPHRWGHSNADMKIGSTFRHHKVQQI